MNISLFIVIGFVALLFLLILMAFSKSQLQQRFAVMDLLMLIMMGLYLALTTKWQIESAYSLYLTNFSEQVSNRLGFVMNDMDYGYKQPEDIDRYISRIKPLISFGKDDIHEYIVTNYAVLEKGADTKYKRVYALHDNEPYGNNPSQDQLDLINQSIANRTVTYAFRDSTNDDMRVDYACTNPDGTSSRYALLLELDSTPINDHINSVVKFNLKMSIVMALIFSVCIFLVAYLQARDIRYILKALNRVNNGSGDWDILQMEPKEVGVRSSEMLTLYNALHQVTNDVQRISYSKYKLLQSYFRFAPRDIEKILGKKSILDVNALDKVQIDATVVLINFDNPNGIDKEDWLVKMSREYSDVLKDTEENSGIIISGNDNYTNIKVMFRNSMADAKNFGTNLIGRDMDDSDDIGRILFLHNTRFTYGVIGDSEKLFTYIESKELNDFESYMTIFRKLKLKMVATKSAVEKLDPSVKKRFIGIYEGDDSENRDLLYEIIDARSSEVRRSLLETKNTFEAALELFYKGEYYAARRGFADCVKECPEDNLAVFYLLWCDKASSEGSDVVISKVFSTKFAGL